MCTQNYLPYVLIDSYHFHESKLCLAIHWSNLRVFISVSTVLVTFAGMKELGCQVFRFFEALSTSCHSSWFGSIQTCCYGHEIL
jgi:hypothetical protein